MGIFLTPVLKFFTRRHLCPLIDTEELEFSVCVFALQLPIDFMQNLVFPKRFVQLASFHANSGSSVVALLLVVVQVQSGWPGYYVRDTSVK